jgi:hypothetical protein
MMTLQLAGEIQNWWPSGHYGRLRNVRLLSSTVSERADHSPCPCLSKLKQAVINSSRNFELGSF